VEEPLLREPSKPLRAALERLRKRAVKTGDGISQRTLDAIIDDEKVASPDSIAQADAIVEDEVETVQGNQAEKKTKGKPESSKD